MKVPFNTPLLAHRLQQRPHTPVAVLGHGGLWRDIEGHNRLSESLVPEQQNGIHKLPRRADRLPVDTAHEPASCDSQLFCLGATPDLHDLARCVHAREERAEGPRDVDERSEAREKGGPIVQIAVVVHQGRHVRVCPAVVASHIHIAPHIHILLLGVPAVLLTTTVALRTVALGHHRRWFTPVAPPPPVARAQTRETPDP